MRRSAGNAEVYSCGKRWRDVALPLVLACSLGLLDVGAAPPDFESARCDQERLITPDQFEGSDVERINLAIEAASAAGCRAVIPRVNLRDGQPHSIWLLDSAILLPSDVTLELDQCHIKISDRCRDNFIRSANCGPGITLGTNDDSPGFGCVHLAERGVRRSSIQRAAGS